MQEIYKGLSIKKSKFCCIVQMGDEYELLIVRIVPLQKGANH